MRIFATIHQQKPNGRGFQEKLSGHQFFRPLSLACPMLQIGVLGQCNRLGRITANEGAKTDRFPQTT